MIEPLYRIVSQIFSTSHNEGVSPGRGEGEADADPVVFCLAVLVCSPNPIP